MSSVSYATNRTTCFGSSRRNPKQSEGEPELARLSVFQRRFLRLQFVCTTVDFVGRQPGYLRRQRRCNDERRHPLAIWTRTARNRFLHGSATRDSEQLLISLTAWLIALVAVQGFSLLTVPIACFIVLLGRYGTAATLKFCERSMYYFHRSRECLRELDKTVGSLEWMPQRSLLTEKLRTFFCHQFFCQSSSGRSAHGWSPSVCNTCLRPQACNGPFLPSHELRVWNSEISVTAENCRVTTASGGLSMGCLWTAPRSNGRLSRLPAGPLRYLASFPLAGAGGQRT